MLNKNIENENYPWIQRIDEIIDKLEGNDYYSSLDLKAGFWKIPTEPESRKYTAFITKYGLFQYTTLMGIKISTSGYQRILERVLKGIPSSICWRLRIYTKTETEHLPSLSTIASPLYHLIKKDTPYIWKEEEDETFKILKDKISKKLLMINPKKGILFKCKWQRNWSCTSPKWLND